MKKIILTAVYSLLVLPASAAVIYSQAPAAGSGGSLSAMYTVNGSAWDEFVWDSFSTATPRTLREIQWRGARSGSSPTDFQISINTTALPGGTIWNIAGNANETPTATPGVYDYRFTLPAGCVLAAGQSYWLQIYAVQNGLPNWLWSSATNGSGNHYAQVPAITGNYRFVLNPGDCAFTLLDQATVPVTITVDRIPAAGGTVTGGGTYAPGAYVTVNATPASGRTFLNWTEAGVVVSTSATFAFFADGNKTLSANFSGPNTGPYVINAVPNPSVNGTVGGAGTFNAGETVDLDITAADGVSFVGWTENGDLVDLPYSGGIFQITAETDRNLVANFAYPSGISYINRVVAPAASGTITTTATSQPAAYTGYYGGTLITLLASPAPGYRFVSWKQGAGIGDLSGAPHIVGTNAVLKHMVCYGTTLTANFAPLYPTLSINVAPVAAGTVSGAGNFAYGSTVTATAAPAVGYAFEGWGFSAAIFSTNPTETLTLTNHTSLTAYFVTASNTVTAVAAPLTGGSVTGAGEVGRGASVTLTALAASGYAFNNWTLDGVPAGTNNPVTFDALGDYAFVANFTAAPQPVSPPRLVMLLTDTNTVILTWPAAASGFLLQQNSDLVTTNWVTAPNAVELVATNHQVVVPMAGASKFFRLKLP